MVKAWGSLIVQALAAVKLAHALLIRRILAAIITFIDHLVVHMLPLDWALVDCHILVMSYFKILRILIPIKLLLKYLLLIILQLSLELFEILALG